MQSMSRVCARNRGSGNEKDTSQFCMYDYISFKVTFSLKIRKSNLFIAAFGQDICMVHASFK